MLDAIFEFIPDKISTWWLAPLVAILFGGWVFFRRQKSVESSLEKAQETIAELKADLEQQKKSNELLHRGMLGLRQKKEQLDSLLSDARFQIRATADSVLIRNPYSEDVLVFLLVHGPAARRIAKMQVDIHGSQAGEVFLSRKTSIFSASEAQKIGQKHQKRVDTKSGFHSRNILTKPLLKFGTEQVGVVQFINEEQEKPFTASDEAKIEPICAKMALLVSELIGDSSNLVQLGVVLDPHINDATILFTDITNSSALFEILPVADATALVDEYLERLGAIAVAQGARIDKHLGDGMMLSFETAGQQNADKALGAALSMQEEFGNILEEWQRLDYALDMLSHRIGIASGPVFGRRMGFGDKSAFTIMGQPVNLASHLCDQARTTPCGILVSEATHTQLSGDILDHTGLEQIEIPHHVAYQVTQVP